MLSPTSLEGVAGHLLALIQPATSSSLRLAATFLAVAALRTSDADQEVSYTLLALLGSLALLTRGYFPPSFTSIL